jgi:hypothetical protein
MVVESLNIRLNFDTLFCRRLSRPDNITFLKKIDKTQMSKPPEATFFLTWKLEVNFSWPSGTSKYVISSLNNLYSYIMRKVWYVSSNLNSNLLTVFPHIVAAATILFWIHKSLKISYSFLIKFSLMLWKLE